MSLWNIFWDVIVIGLAIYVGLPIVTFLLLLVFVAIGGMGYFLIENRRTRKLLRSY